MCACAVLCVLGMGSSFIPCIYMYMNNQYIEHYLERKEKGKKEKERKLQQPQWFRKI